MNNMNRPIRTMRYWPEAFQLKNRHFTNTFSFQNCSDSTIYLQKFVLTNQQVIFKCFLKDFSLLKLLSQYKTKKIWFQKIIFLVSYYRDIKYLDMMNYKLISTFQKDHRDVRGSYDMKIDLELETYYFPKDTTIMFLDQSLNAN